MFPTMAQAVNENTVTANEGPLTSGEQLLQAARTFLAEQGADFALRLLAALAILLLGRWTMKFVLRLSKSALERAHADEILVRFAGNALRAVLMIVILLAALQTLGVAMTSVTAVLAAAGFAIGMSLQGSLSNLAAGILLVVIKPFRVGDYIEVAGVAGSVEQIRLFHCEMDTFDGVRLTVPNSSITTGVIKNYTIEPFRMITLVIGCSYDDDLRGVKSLLTEIVQGHELVLSDPPATIAVDELGSSSVNFVVRPWVNNADYWAVKRQLVEQIKLAFDEQGFNFPYPSHDVHLHSSAES